MNDVFQVRAAGLCSMLRKPLTDRKYSLIFIQDLPYSMKGGSHEGKTGRGESREEGLR